MAKRDAKMGKVKRTQYTPEFRQEAARLVEVRPEHRSGVTQPGYGREDAGQLGQGAACR
jgi:hypothetical protein